MMDIYKNVKGRKSLLIIGIILFVVFMGLGLLIYSGEIDAEYEVLTKNTSENVYAKLNVSLLDSAFATETLDGKEKDYYIAFDENDNPFIIVLDKDGLKNALTTGRGRIFVRSKVSIEKEKNKTSLIVTEIPYDILKVNIVKKIDEIRIDKKIEGIIEVRDESDKDGLRIAIDIKKEADEQLILNYLYKNTDLQASYNYNMIAIVKRRPKLLSVLDILDAYIEHFKEVVLYRTKFDLNHAEKRLHIVLGLIKAVSILDEVIRTIRQSKNKADAKENLVKKFEFTMEQAEAIVTLQLYRLSNTDMVLLEEEANNLKLIIEGLSKIINEEEVILRYEK